MNWSPRRLIEEQYRRALMNLLDKFILMLPGLDLTNPFDLVSELNQYAATDLFSELAHSIASRMVTGLAMDQKRTWREAAQESMQGRRIYELLRNEMHGPTGYRMQNIIQQNAALIKTFPLNISKQVNSYITREMVKGRRSESIAEDLKKKFPEVAESRIKLIARTETSKASTALTRTRSEDLGLDWYAWRTSNDARVRQSHRKMDGVLVSWADPASPEALVGEKSYGQYAPGDIFNCRCYPEPLIKLDQVSWPHRVYVNGSVKYMTRRQFQNMTESGPRKAA